VKTAKKATRTASAPAPAARKVPAAPKLAPAAAPVVLTPAQKAWATRRAAGDTGSSAALKAWDTRRKLAAERHAAEAAAQAAAVAAKAAKRRRKSA
jgi:hypothetical protein